MNQEKSVPEWKLKTCVICNKEYLKGTGITKIEFFDENKVLDYPDWKYIGFEGIEEVKGYEYLEEKSYSTLCFCSNKCCEEYFEEAVQMGINKGR